MQRHLVLAFVTILATATFAGCAENDGGTPTPATPTGSSPLPAGNLTASGPGEVQPMAEGAYRVTFETSMGNFVAELYEDKAPLSVANFIAYANAGAYDGTVFHRVVKGFVIQGGGFSTPFNGQDSKRETPWGPIPTEMWTGTQHVEGSLGMARTNDPNSGTSQWFVNTKRNTNLDAGYTVFGQVTEGMDVVHAIENVATTTKAGFQNVPRDDVVITKVRVQTPDAPAKANVVAYTAEAQVAPGGTVSLPFLVKNVGGAPLTPSLAGTGPAGSTLHLVHTPGDIVAGHAGVAIVDVTVPADFAGGDLVVQAGAGDGAAAAKVTLKPLAVTGNAAGAEHGKVSTGYIGVYDNGVVFDTTRTDLAARGFTLPGGFQEHPDPLKVWVGSGSTSDAAYTPVIPGFASGIVGLHGGETRTVRLTSAEGYDDGYFRIFEMDVVSVDS